jgi:hypothetical protein
MLACGFSKAEANDRAQRMAIYRHLKKVGQPKQDNTNKFVTPPTLVVDVPVLNESALSSVTVSLSDVIVPGEDDDPSLHGPPKRVRLTACQKQNVLNERKKKERVYNRAFKRATICYAREKGKKGGKSAREVCEMARREFSVDLSPRTIQDAVSKGRIGVSPLRRGPRGSIPDVHYKNLCIAFESFLAINQDNGGMCVFAHERNWERFSNVWFMERRPKEKHKHITCLLEWCGTTTSN